MKAKATLLLTHQAFNELKAGYTFVGNVQVIVQKATITGTTPNLVFSSQGTWIYGVTPAAQEHIKKIIAGKTKQEAMQLLTMLPGIQNVSMQWDENTKLPKDIRNIHLIFFISR